MTSDLHRVVSCGSASACNWVRESMGSHSKGGSTIVLIVEDASIRTRNGPVCHHISRCNEEGKHPQSTPSHRLLLIAPIIGERWKVVGISHTEKQ